ncbi:hypothetical protein AQUCO_02700273v1 [Aquilegia coerulea]|uniref:Factor of DNA methylation 1-5/IDN2 domain-containing protein n=1 Tax=Aquilegia coerulea TaxID=218851 RepID=A0A2G5D625_AQUCA|nr:hypothetical protein AQUCO_02700273v1 [Aquilegia coerulea]
MEEELHDLLDIRRKLSEEIYFKNRLLEDSEIVCKQLSTHLKKVMSEKDELLQLINVKDQTMEEMNNKCSELSRDLDKAMDEKNELQQLIDLKDQMSEEMRNRCNELSVALNRAMDEKDELREEMRTMKCSTNNQSLRLCEEIEKLKYEVERQRKEFEEQDKDWQGKSLRLCEENEKLKYDLECQRKELEEQDKDWQGHEDQINLQKHYVTLAKNTLKKELETIEEKTEEVDYWEQQYQLLTVMLRKSNIELEEVRKALVDALGYNRRAIGIKRMGLLDEKPFREACSQKFPDAELDVKSVELCSFWQEQIESDWYPFKITSTNGNFHVYAGNR